MTALSVDEFDSMIADVRHSLCRWEAQPVYHEPEEAEPFARWLANQPDDLAWLASWLDHVREATRAGLRYMRVRRLADPPTCYQTWCLTIAPANEAAGEKIRLLDEGEAENIGMPEYDFVLIDDQVVARMRFGDTGFVGANLIEDPAEVGWHRRWLGQAWHHAVTVSAYASRSP